MPKRCIVIASALEDSCAIELKANDYIIAADAGYLCCRNRNITPDFVIGDFDSMHIEELEGAACEHMQLPCAKDDTDTVAALRFGLEQGYQEFHIYGAISTDMAHSFANLQCLSFLQENGAQGFIHTEGQVAQLVTPGLPLVFKDMIHKRLSVFSWEKEARGVTIKGARWEYEKQDMTNAFPVGVSNVIVADYAHVSVEGGQLLCILG